MPALPAFITYRPGKKAKAAIRAPFSLLRGEGSSSSSTTQTPSRALDEAEVLDINDRAYCSLDFDGGKATSDFGHDLQDEVPRPKGTHNTSSPQVKLDIDISPGALTDWFPTNFLEDSFTRLPKCESAALKGSAADLSRNLNARPGLLEVEDDNDGLSTTPSDLVASLEAMDASDFVRLSGLQGPEQQDKATTLRSRALPKPLHIPPNGPLSSNGSSIRSRPPPILDSPVSSAISGTTLARALLSNSFSLSGDRSSRYRSGAAGLTRSDSTTLPRGDFGSPSHDDRFSIGADAPPIPAGAELLYEPPRKARGLWRDKRRPTLKRRSSTGSIENSLLPLTPPIPSPRPNSGLVSPGSESVVSPALSTGIEGKSKTPSPRPPLPPTPKATQLNDCDKDSVQSSPLNPSQKTTDIPPVNPQPQPLTPELTSTPSSIGSAVAQNLDDVLNYYSLPDTLEPITTNYRPIFSPISEESSSQLSPPTPYRNDRRESRQQPIGARSPLTGSSRGRGEQSRRPSNPRMLPQTSPSLQPLAERPQSTMPFSSPTNIRSNTSLNSVVSDLEPLEPPQLNRQRSDSAPIPIKAVRQSVDLNALNITIASRQGQPETPTTGESASSFPQSPETPNGLLSSVEGVSNEMIPQSMESPVLPPKSNAPSSGTLPHANNDSPSVPQKILQRASTGVSHSGQPSPSPLKTTLSQERAGSSSTLQNMDLSESPIEEDLPSTTQDEVASISSGVKRVSDSSVEESVTPGLSTGFNVVSRSSSQGTSIEQPSTRSSMYTSSRSSGSLRLKSLPVIPISPTIMRISMFESTLAQASGSPAPGDIPKPSTSGPPPSQISQMADSRNDQLPVLVAPTQVPESSTAQSAAVQEGGHAEESSSATTPQAQEANESTFDEHLLSSRNSDIFTGRQSDIFRGTSLASPPPYYTVVSDAMMHDTQATPNSFLSPGFSSSNMSQSSVSGPSYGGWATPPDPFIPLAREPSAGSQRNRPRPPLPIGPRGPSQLFAFGSPPQFSRLRDRTGSVSSVGSNPLLLAAGRQPRPSHLPSPKFQVPPPKWRGYTMEAAKWTFTSQQLQEIVSRAIRQSAEASSLRLLSLEVLEEEIPTEIRQLEAQRTDLKTRYKVLARRRATLFEALSAQIDDPASALRLVEDLREMAITLDRLAEELHSLDEQLGHLDSLTHIHSGSALAMALRKLNSSFLKQIAENQVLRNQVQTLEAERDEAWREAEFVAKEFDHMSGSPTTPSSRRSSRVSAVRKSSIRVSKAGLRRMSNRSSVGSNYHGMGPGSARSPEPIPPVPPIPRPLALQLTASSPVQSPPGMSTGGSSANSQVRALAEAQDELYAMLGLTNPEPRVRRARSASQGAPRDLSPLGSALPPLLSATRSPNGIQPRRSSLPPDPSLAEAYNVMAVDRQAMLATIDMLSSAD